MLFVFLVVGVVVIAVVVFVSKLYLHIAPRPVANIVVGGVVVVVVVVSATRS